MRVLLAVNQQTDPLLLSACVAERFYKANVKIDVVTVLAPGLRSRGRGASPRTSAEIVALTASELRDKHGFDSVRKYVESGDTVEALVTASTRLRSGLIVIEARQSGMLTAFRLDGVTRRLLRRSQCPVELLRPRQARAKERFNVLLPLSLDQIDSYPWSSLQALPWAPGSRLLLMGVVPPAVDAGCIEANAAAVLRSLKESDDARAAGMQRLAALRDHLASRMGRDIRVDFQIAEGNTRDVAVEYAHRTDAALIVLGCAATDGAFRGLLSTLSPATIALSAPCSVLVSQVRTFGWLG